MRVLIVRLSSLGDVVHASTVLPDIRRAHPQALVDWVVEEAFAPLVRCFDGVQRVVPIALRRWRRRPLASTGELRACWQDLRAHPYDAVLDLQGLIKSAVVARAARLAPGGRRVGLGNRTVGAGYEGLARLAYDVSVRMPDRIHVVDRSRRLAAEALGHPVDGPPRVPWRPQPGDTGTTNDVLLVHGSARASKVMPTAFWERIGRALAADGARVLLPWGTADERTRASALVAGIGAGSILLDRLPLDELVATIARLRGCIGIDTGLTHIAATHGLPTVQLFLEDKDWQAGAYWQPATALLRIDDADASAVERTLHAWRSLPTVHPAV